MNCYLFSCRKAAVDFKAVGTWMTGGLLKFSMAYISVGLALATATRTKKL